MLCEQINDIVEIYLLPEGSLSLATPFQVSTTTVDISEFSVADAALHLNPCFALSVPPFHGKPDFSVEMDDSASVTVTTERTRGGFQKKISVEVEISDYSDQIEARLLEFEKKPHHLLMYRADGRRLFARCDPFAYACEVEDTSDVKTVKFELTNINGLQTVI